MKQDILYIVVPCYNEQEILPRTTPRLLEKLKQLTEKGLVSNDSRILLVNDGSTDATWTLIEKFCTDHEQVCGIKLAGNVGHQNALLAGLETANEHADITISIDADLQDDINVMEQMIE